jgi:hypothetical protein
MSHLFQKMFVDSMLLFGTRVAGLMAQLHLAHSAMRRSKQAEGAQKHVHCCCISRLQFAR